MKGSSVIMADSFEFRLANSSLERKSENYFKGLFTKNEDIRREFVKFIVCAFLALTAVFVFAFSKRDSLVCAVIEALMCFVCMALIHNVYKSGFKNIFLFKPNADSIFCLFTIVPFLYGVFEVIYNLKYGKTIECGLYFPAVAVCSAFILFGKCLDNALRHKNDCTADMLLGFIPEKITVRRAGSKLSVGFNEIIEGDIATVMPGEKIPFDALVISGSTTVDESALTGDDSPSEKQEGSRVFAGSINKYGEITIKSTGKSSDNIISHLINAAKRDSNSDVLPPGPPHKICGLYILAVIAVSLFVSAGVSFSQENLLNVFSRIALIFIMSCPCTLALAEPLAVIGAVKSALKKKILIQNPNSVKMLGSVDIFAFDKGGTLTEGTQAVTDLYITEGFNEAEVLEYALSVESVSYNAMSDAIYDYAYSRGVSPKKIDSFETLDSDGIKVVIGNDTVIFGNESIISEYNISAENKSVSEKLKSEGKNVMYLAVNGVLAAIIASADLFKPDASEMLRKIEKYGIKTLVFENDSFVGADTMEYELNHKEKNVQNHNGSKSEKIKKLQSEGFSVAMAGDGINDTVALMFADVGISVGSATAAALEAADIIIMDDKLLNINEAVELSRRYKRRAGQNMFFAFIYNILLIPFAAHLFEFANVPINLGMLVSAIILSITSIFINNSIYELFK